MSRSFTLVLATVFLTLSLSLFAPGSLAAENGRPSTDATATSVTSWFGAVQNLVTNFWKSLFAPEADGGIASRTGTAGALDDNGFEAVGGGDDDDDEYGPYADPTGSRDP